MNDKVIHDKIMKSTNIPTECKTCKHLVIPFKFLKDKDIKDTCRLSRISCGGGWCGKCEPNLCNKGTNYYG